jgi:flagellar biosynthesis protein FlhB
MRIFNKVSKLLKSLLESNLTKRKGNEMRSTYQALMIASAVILAPVFVLGWVCGRVRSMFVIGYYKG